MRPFVVQKDEEGAQPHYVYDLSLPLPERAQKRMPFNSACAVANWLGVTPQRVFTNRKSKCRIWSESHGRWFAVRIAKKDQPCTTDI